MQRCRLWRKRTCMASKCRIIASIGMVLGIFSASHSIIRRKRSTTKNDAVNMYVNQCDNWNHLTLFWNVCISQFIDDRIDLANSKRNIICNVPVSIANEITNCKNKTVKNRWKLWFSHLTARNWNRKTMSIHMIYRTCKDKCFDDYMWTPWRHHTILKIHIKIYCLVVDWHSYFAIGIEWKKTHNISWCNILILIDNRTNS